MAVGAARAEAEGIPIVLAALPVAGLAVGRRALEDEIGMAFPAGQRAVLPGEGEIRPVVGLDRPLLRGLGGLSSLGGLLLPRSVPDPEDKKEREDEGRGHQDRRRGFRSKAGHGVLIDSGRSI